MTAPVPVPIDQRFALLIQQFGLTKNSFAISLGKTASVVQHLIDGRNKPGYDLLCKVFEIYPNVSRDWLLLGRGPMLVSGEPAFKQPTPAAKTPEPEPPLEPIDLSDVEVSSQRRSASPRLQPAEIAATLALAAAVNQPVRTTFTAPPESQEPPTSTASKPPTTTENPTNPAGLAGQMSAEPAPMAPSPPPVPVSQPAPLPTVTAIPGAEAYVAAALHAQHLQHQLALAELRNQHLQEQQQMLREMLAMARQGMV